MITFAARRASKVAAGICLLAAGIAPGIALSQDTLGQLAERQSQIVDELERMELEYGPQARELIEPLTALSLFYEEAGDYRLADPAIERLLQVIRANYGLYSLEQVPSIRLLIGHELARGNATAAWELEQGMLRLAARNPQDIGTAEIFREVGDRRIDILDRYLIGEIPPEIELGCYYSAPRDYLRAQRRGSQPIYSAPGTQSLNSCTAGSRNHATRALANDAHSLYTAAVEVMVYNDLQTSEEFRELVTTMLHTSHDQNAPTRARRALQYLIASYPEDEDPLPRIEAEIQLADWNLMMSSEFGTRFRDTALDGYREAYAELLALDVEPTTIDALFAPGVPIMLPSFAPNPIVSRETRTSRGYIDVEFVVMADGKSDDIDIVATMPADLPRDASKALIDAIKHGRFRPMITGGAPADSEPIVVRHYLND
jgi:hypothetical protein